MFLLRKTKFKDFQSLELLQLTTETTHSELYSGLVLEVPWHSMDNLKKNKHPNKQKTRVIIFGGKKGKAGLWQAGRMVDLMIWMLHLAFRMIMYLMIMWTAAMCSCDLK